MNPKKHYLARIPTIALLIIFAFKPWIGILLFILKRIEKATLNKEQENADYASDFRSSTYDGETAYGHDNPTDEQIKAKKRQKIITNICTGFGALFLIAGVVTLADADTYFEVSEVLSALCQAIGGGGALWLGLQMNHMRKLERQLDKIVGDRDNMPLDEIFAAAGINREKGRAVIENAIDHGYFGADAYIDNRTDTLIVRGKAPQPPQHEPEPSKPSSEDVYSALLRQLREANDAVSDPVMSAKISRLEQLSGRIFMTAQKDPQKEPQLRKFIDYYLPTALKLLKTYAQLCSQDVEGQNIKEAKQNIERSMDMLITAFENQLDKLFQADALDVSADIAALEGMMNLDGLTTDSDFDLKN